MWHIILVTKVSVTDDLEDELLEGGDDLELGNEIIDDDLFDLWSQTERILLGCYSYDAVICIPFKQLSKKSTFRMVDTNEVESHLIDRYEIRRRLGK